MPVRVRCSVGTSYGLISLYRYSLKHLSDKLISMTFIGLELWVLNQLCPGVRVNCRWFCLCYPLHLVFQLFSFLGSTPATWLLWWFPHIASTCLDLRDSQRLLCKAYTQIHRSLGGTLRKTALWPAAFFPCLTFFSDALPDTARIWESSLV